MPAPLTPGPAPRTGPRPGVAAHAQGAVPAGGRGCLSVPPLAPARCWPGPRCRRQARGARAGLGLSPRPGRRCARSTPGSSPRSCSTTTAPAACCPSGWTSRAGRAATRCCSRAAGGSCAATGVGTAGRDALGPRGAGWMIWWRWNLPFCRPTTPFFLSLPFFLLPFLPFPSFSLFLHFLCFSSFVSFSPFSFSFPFFLSSSPFSSPLPIHTSDWGRGSALCTQG